MCCAIGWQSNHKPNLPLNYLLTQNTPAHRTENTFCPKRNDKTLYFSDVICQSKAIIDNWTVKLIYPSYMFLLTPLKALLMYQAWVKHVACSNTDDWKLHFCPNFHVVAINCLYWLRINTLVSCMFFFSFLFDKKVYF